MPKTYELGMTEGEIKIAHKLISDRPGLAELLAGFKSEAGRPPFPIADAAAVVVVRAFMLGQAVGRRETASRVRGAVRQELEELERQPLGRA